LEVEEVEDDATIPSNYLLYGGKKPTKKQEKRTVGKSAHRKIHQKNVSEFVVPHKSCSTSVHFTEFRDHFVTHDFIGRANIRNKTGLTCTTGRKDIPGYTNKTPGVNMAL